MSLTKFKPTPFNLSETETPFSPPSGPATDCQKQIPSSPVVDIAGPGNRIPVGRHNVTCDSLPIRGKIVQADSQSENSCQKIIDIPVRMAKVTVSLFVFDDSTTHSRFTRRFPQSERGGRTLFRSASDPPHVFPKPPGKFPAAMKTHFFTLGLLCGLVTFAAAQSTISTTDKYAYAANAGWIDFRTSAADGVRVADTFLSGYAYSANFGYIHFGTTAPATGPANGHTYSNFSASDYGVNLSFAGLLTGYAYAPNIGYILFEQNIGQPKLDLLTGVFSGYAYSANVGWIALATPLSVLATTTISRPDTDGDGIPDAWERFYFGNLTTATATSDWDGDGVSDLDEYNAGTDPKDRNSKLRITAHTYAAAFTQATLTWTTVPNRRYRLEYDNDLLGTWTNSTLNTFSPDAGATTTRTLTGLSASPRRFFRVEAVQPLP